MGWRETVLTDGIQVTRLERRRESARGLYATVEPGNLTTYLRGYIRGRKV